MTKHSKNTALKFKLMILCMIFLPFHKIHLVFVFRMYTSRRPHYVLHSLILFFRIRIQTILLTTLYTRKSWFNFKQNFRNIKLNKTNWCVTITSNLFYIASKKKKRTFRSYSSSFSQANITQFEIKISFVSEIDTF